MANAQATSAGTGDPSSAISSRWCMDEWLARIHYVLFLGVFSVYGYQVCPFLEKLSPADLIVPAAVTLGLCYLLRGPLKACWADRPLEFKVRAHFWSDFGLFIVGGLSLAVFNFVAFSFPPDSGVKVLFAFATLGFYMSLDLAFEREFKLGRELSASNQPYPISKTFRPYQHKFVLFSTINLFVLSTTCILIIYKDLIWTIDTNPDLKMAQLVIMGEVFYAVGIIAAYMIRVISQYSRNVNARIAAENMALENVQNGNLNAMAAIISNDEFGQMADLTNKMIRQLRSSVEEIEQTQSVTIMSLTSLAGKRDNETGMHIRRTQTYVVLLAEALRRYKGYGERISDETVDVLFRSAPLHDIGKVGIPDAILQKPGKLDDDEFEIMKTHAQIGADALAEAEQVLGRSSFLATAREIAATHHEKWNGTGYPMGLKGDRIPLSGRLMAVADVYDALRSKRVYKPAFCHTKAAAIIVLGKGSHFDPDIVDAFVMVQHLFEKISNEMADAENGTGSESHMTGWTVQSVRQAMRAA